MAEPPVSPVEGSAFPWILEHLLAYPGTYEIPLRTMYTNNVLAAQTNRPPTPSLFGRSSPSLSPTLPYTPQFPGDFNRQSTVTQTATDHFKSCLMEQISYLPSQPFSLPPSFITSFVRRCFTEDLCLVDFTQALTALDYLKDLETRRKRELSAVLRRLGINVGALDRDRSELLRRSPTVAEWISRMEDKERRVEALYTQVYIGLRRWTLINEMRLSPFNKPNCIAMLNTLYPPNHLPPPTPQLTTTILSSQRHAFFRYIQAVEKNGKAVLSNLENQSRRSGDTNGWLVVREIVDRYLRTANTVLDECVAIKGPEDIEAQYDPKSGRRTDSGVSFASQDRPGTSTGHHTNSNAEKPLPLSPRTPQLPPTPGKKTGSTLERIFRRLKSRDADAKVQNDNTPENGANLKKKRSLKKMKSTSNLGRSGSDRKGSHSRGGSGERVGLGLFEIDEERREQLIREAKALRDKENRAPKQDDYGLPVGRVELE